MTKSARHMCYSCGSTNIITTNKEKYRCSDCEVIASPTRFTIYDKFDIGDYNGVVVTGVQNNTKLDRQALYLVNSYCKTHNLKLIISVIYYNNRGKMNAGENHEETHLDPNIIKHLSAAKIILGDYYIGCDIKTQVTTPSPLNTVQEVSGSKHLILPHSRRQIMCKSTHEKDMPKVAMTTGVITESNVAQTSIGARSKFHHYKGFVVIHKSDACEYIARQVEIKGGECYDLGIAYSGKRKPVPVTPLGYVMGDFHASQHSRLKFKLTAELAKKIRPMTLIFHDLFNGKSCNPHTVHSAVDQQVRHDNNQLSVRDELKYSYDKAWELGSLFKKVYQAYSNHDHFLVRWLNNTDWRKDRVNGKFYLKMANWVMDNATVCPEYGVNDYDGLMEYAIEESGGKPIDIAERGTKLGKFTVALHGHRGEGGTRGGLNQYAKLPFKSIIGHAHKFGAQDGCLQTGTSTALAQDYTGNDLTNWGWADVLVARNGTAQHVIFWIGDNGVDWGNDFIDAAFKKKHSSVISLKGSKK